MAAVYEQLYDGQWREVHMQSFQNQCCHCGLVHDIKFRKLKRGVKIRVSVNKRATAAVRRAFRFEKERDDA